ncbi:MAG TPA: hypothetical protein VFE30_01460 [Anaeromyxobacteraceae bacterium]|nr:hypothetical protein [Anaeromyxobacteraceae bacterium]
MRRCRVVVVGLAALLGVGTAAAREGAGSPPAAPAFPGAQGSGAWARGGRGGEVFEVTTLRDSGPGSLRECVEASGPRTCVFRVGGVIQVERSMTVDHPFLTIAGQTAPGGVALAIRRAVSRPNTWILDVKTHDVVVRYLRFWGDYVPGDRPDRGNGSYGVVLHDPASRVIVDHCDLLWFTGKAFAGWGNSFGDLTLQWSIVGENVSGGQGGQSTPILVSSSTFDPDRVHGVDLHHNLIASGDERNPLVCSDSARIVNNVIYNWRYFAVGVDNGGSADIIGNHWKPGPGPKSCIREVLVSRAARRGTLYLANNRSDWGGPGARCSTDFGRRVPASGHEPDGGWALLTGGSARYQGSASGGDDPELTPLPASFKRAPWAPLPSEGIPIRIDPVASLPSVLAAAGGSGASRRLDCVGGWVPARDPTERRILQDLASGAGPVRTPRSAEEANRGPLPSLKPRAPCADADHDGIPDEWERAHGLDPRDPLDGRKMSRDGYTNLEHYLNGE